MSNKRLVAFAFHRPLQFFYNVHIKTLKLLVIFLEMFSGVPAPSCFLGDRYPALG